MSNSRQSDFLRNQGILYIRSEYHQAQLGLSIVRGGGEMGPLTTTYEWWIDVQNPAKVRRVTTEWLDDGPHIVGADGSDGNGNWWRVDYRQGMTTPEYHTSEFPFPFPDALGVAEMFASNGQSTRTAWQQGEATLVEQLKQAPWGKLDVIRQIQPATGHTVTATFRSEAPFVLVERVVVDQEGNLFEQLRLTHWQWLEPAELPDDFWMNPPAGIPIGP